MQNEQVKTSDMSEFEKQLNMSNIVDLDAPEISRLKENEINIIDGTRQFQKSQEIVPQNQPQVIQKENLVNIQKNIILVFLSDSTGCGFIRAWTPFSYLNFVFGKDQKLLPIISSCFIQDQNILLRTRTIYFQRSMSPEHLNVIRWYKQNQSQYKFRMIWEMDDFIWDDPRDGSHGVPNFNFGARGITREVKNASIEIMKLMDQLIVSTQPLANYIKNELKINTPIKVIKNHVPKFFWKDINSKKITDKIVKPKFICTSSPTHYSSEKKLLGDFDNAWREYIIKNVQDKKIDFTCFGGLPWFFEEIKDSIKVVPWINSFSYHNAVLAEKADFGIMPLVPNYFSFCKSNLKFLEYSAAKVLALGTYFKEGEPYQGPYSDMPVRLDWKCSIKDIEETVAYCSQPENYNRIITQQLSYLEKNNHWLESPGWINEFLSVL